MPYKPPKNPDAKLRRKNKREDTRQVLSGKPPIPDQAHPITIRVSTRMLSEIDSHIPGHGKIQREQFVLDALKAYLGHRDKASFVLPRKVTKAISKSTGEIQTGRYEP